MSRIISRLFQEEATVEDSGFVKFDRGAEYLPVEIQRLRKKPPHELQAIHLIKTTFGGTIEFLPFVETVNHQRAIPTDLPRYAPPIKDTANVK